MATPEPVRLPSVGHLLDLHDEDGAPVRVVRRKDGVLEIHGPAGTTVLDPLHAAALGSLASGRIVVRPELIERSSRMLGGLEFDWVVVPDGGAAAGRSIAELEFRKRTGTTIVAIFRGTVPIIDPDPDQRLEVGDELVLACRPEDRAAIERFVAEGH